MNGLPGQLSAMGRTRRRVAPAGLSYVDEVLADSPISFWRMGANLNDSSGNGRHGTFYNSPTVQTGPVTGGSATRFNGSNQYGSVAYGSWMDVSPLTMELWIRWLSQPVDNAQVLGRAVSSLMKVSYRINYPLNVPMITGGYFDGSSRIAKIESIPVTLNVWQNYVTTIEHSGSSRIVKTFMNGAQVDSYSTNVAVPLTTEGLFFGAENNRRFVHADIAEVALYNHALDPSRIAAHYAARNNP